jgi:hypothetical protein
MIGTQPDIAWLISRLSQYMQESMDKHIEATKHVFHYLQQTTNHKIRYQSAGHSGLIGYLDADWSKN